LLGGRLARCEAETLEEAVGRAALAEMAGGNTRVFIDSFILTRLDGKPVEKDEQSGWGSLIVPVQLRNSNPGKLRGNMNKR